MVTLSCQPMLNVMRYAFAILLIVMTMMRMMMMMMMTMVCLWSLILAMLYTTGLGCPCHFRGVIVAFGDLAM